VPVATGHGHPGDDRPRMLLRVLQRADAYSHPVREVEHLETHISTFF